MTALDAMFYHCLFAVLILKAFCSLWVDGRHWILFINMLEVNVYQRFYLGFFDTIFID